MAKKLQKCGTEQEMREVAGKICKNYLPGLWKAVEPDDLQFTKITGGLSNFIYVLGLPEDLAPLYARLEAAEDADKMEDTKSLRSGSELEEPKKVLLRIYGQVHGERAMDAIVTESVIFTLLSERKLGPKLFGVFSGGRIEEYIPSRCLLLRELADPELSMKIAEKMAAIHSMDIPLSKEPTFIWKSMYKWLKTIKDEAILNNTKPKNDTEREAMLLLKEINYDHEIDWLKKYLATIDSPVVFCHNDLQEGNILLLDESPQQTTDEFEPAAYTQPFGSKNSLTAMDNEAASDSERISRPDLNINMSSHMKLAPTHEETLGDEEVTSDTIISRISDSGEGPKIFLIDFEYCAYNYRGFDIANHFAEWAYDYTKKEPPFFDNLPENWPTLEQKEIFIREYLKHFHQFQGEEGAENNMDAVNKLLGEVDAFTLASHLFWTLWSIVNTKSQIPFGYWEYGVARLETYLRLKQEVIKKEKFGLPQKRKIEEVDI